MSLHSARTMPDHHTNSRRKQGLAGQHGRSMRSRGARLAGLLRNALRTDVILDFLEKWRASRSQTRFVAGLPWLLALVCTAFLLVPAVLRDRQSLAKTYEKQLQQARQSGNTVLQTQSLEALADLDSGNPVRCMDLGKFLISTGKREAGLARIRKAADGFSPGLADAHVWLARDLIYGEDRSQTARDDAERHLKTAVELSPGIPGIHLLLADYYTSIKEPYLAAEHLVSAARLEPTLYPRAISLTKRNRMPPESTEKLRKEAVETLGARLTLKPTDARLRAAMADVYILNQQLAEANQILEEAQKTDAPELIRKQQSRWHVEKALSLLTASPLNRDRCVPLLVAAFRLDPKNYSALRLAEELHRTGMTWPEDTFAGLIEQLSEQLEADPEADAVRIRLSQFLRLDGRDAQATEVLQVIQQKSDRLRLLYVRLLMSSGQQQAGVQSGEELLATLRGNPASTEQTLLTAECLLLLNRPLEALQMLGDLGRSIPPEQLSEELAALYARACLAAADVVLESGQTASELASDALPDAAAADGEDSPVLLLTKALSWRSTNYEALDRLTRLSLEERPESAQAAAVLQALRVEGKLVAEILSITGVNAIRMEKYDIAQQTLSQARVCTDSGDPQILNNLALAMIRNNPQSGNESLDTVNLALTLVPEHPDLLSTRGEIHMAMEQWSEALRDLTKSIESRPKSVLVHRLLEKTCLNLNAERRALQHREAAERLEGAMTSLETTSK
ncbi:MAG: hypothetical protein WCK86_01915 [Planctomycetia bacterium]